MRDFYNFRHPSNSVFALLAIMMLLFSTAFGQTADEIQKLSLNKPLERSIKGGETQTFEFKLKKGEFARVEVVPTNIDVIVSLLDVDGKTFIEMDGDYSFLWRESVSAIAKSGGIYKIQIKDKGAAEKVGSYSVEIVELRKSAANDNKRLEAEQNLAQAIKTFLGNKPKDSILMYENSLKLWREIGDKYWEAVTEWNLAWNYEYENRYDDAMKSFEQVLPIFQELNERKWIGRTFQGLGVIWIDKKEYEKARGYLEQALPIRRELKDLMGEYNTLNYLLRTYFNLNQPEKVTESQSRMLAIRDEQKDQASKADSLKDLGKFYMDVYQYGKAAEFYEKALPIYLELKDIKNEIYLRMFLGLIYGSNAEYEKAKIHLERYAELTKETGEAENWNVPQYLGLLYDALQQYDKALANYEKALEIAKKLDDSHTSEGQTLTAIGVLYDNKGLYKIAQTYFEDSLKTAQISKDETNEAFTLTLLSNYYSNLGQYQKSRDCFNRISEIALKQKNNQLMEVSTTGFGSVYADLSQNNRAKNFFEQSLKLVKENNDIKKQSQILAFLGNTYVNFNDYEKASAYFEISLLYAKEVNSKSNQASAFVGLGKVNLKINLLDKSQSFYEQGLILAREVKDRNNEGSALDGLGVVYFKNKKYREAEDFYRQSLGIAREVQSKKLEASVLQNLMELFKELGKPQVAVAYGKQAVNIFQEIRGNIKGFEKESQQSYLRDKETAYRTLANLLISESRFYEAQSVLNLLKEEEYSQLNRGEPGEIIPYSDIETNLLELSAKLAELQQRKEQLPKSVDMNEEQSRQSAGLIKEIEAMKKAFDETLKQLAVTEKSVKDQIDALYENKTKNSIQNRVRDLQNKTTGVVALYTLIGREETAEKKNAREEKAKFGWVILVAGNVQRAYPIDVKDFNDNVFALLSALSSTERNPQPVAEKIYNSIFRQKSSKSKTTLEQDLQKLLGAYQNKTLMWSLDGVLRYIPMAALHDGEGYLAEKYLNTVFTDKSISSLLANKKDDWQILGLGVSEQRENFAALPGVKTELETIVRETDSTAGIMSGAIKLNGNFKKELFFNLLSDGDYPVVHIASHYYFNPAQQNDSFLLMGDGRLTFDELNNDTLFNNVDLLTLSACDTGASGNGTEIEGFPYKAQQSGAKSVLASLWKVSDAGTPELMIRFYRLTAQNPSMSKGEAFRQAQLEMLAGDSKSAGSDETKLGRGSELVGGNAGKLNLPLFVRDDKKPFAHPHYWAAFVLIGNWR